MLLSKSVLNRSENCGFTTHLERAPTRRGSKINLQDSKTVLKFWALKSLRTFKRAIYALDSHRSSKAAQPHWHF